MRIQCLITVLGQFFKSFYATKKKKHWCGGRKKKKKAFAVLWLQIITTQWTNICLVNSPITKPRPRDCGAICNLVPRYVFMSSTNFPLRRPRQTWEKLLRGHPAARRVWGTHIFLMHHLGFVKSQARNISACRPQPATRCQEIDSSKAKAELTPQLAGDASPV